MKKHIKVEIIAPWQCTFFLFPTNSNINDRSLYQPHVHPMLHYDRIMKRNGIYAHCLAFSVAEHGLVLHKVIERYYYDDLPTSSGRAEFSSVVLSDFEFHDQRRSRLYYRYVLISVFCHLVA